MEKVKQILKKIPKHVWILSAIILAGIFFRIYNFQDWLYFSTDQSRDAALAETAARDDVWPLFGPHMNHTEFLVGPAYYYFQIISVKIFGPGPTHMAYPDLLFSILSIPLFYYFLIRYFNQNLSLAITGLYAVSFYSIQYARFALNPNPSPFFALLFLLSMGEFVSYREKTRWGWIIAIGVSLGIAVQLHAITLVLFCLIATLTFAFLLKNNRQMFSRWAVIFLVAIFLNAPQIIGDARNGFANSKMFFQSSKNQAGNSQNLFRNSILFVDCQSQTNLFMISSLGDKENCQFLYTGIERSVAKIKKTIKSDHSFLSKIFFGTLFFVFGYGLLFYNLKAEKNRKKKIFLALLSLYATLSFLIMLPMGEALEPRYFIHSDFLPFVFLGFLAAYLDEKIFSKSQLITVSVFILLIIFNLSSLFSEAREFSQKNKSHDNYAVLGELETAFDFVQKEAYPQKEAYVYGKPVNMWTIFGGLDYIGKREDFNLIRIPSRDSAEIPPGKPVFSIMRSSKTFPESDYIGRKVESFKNVGQFGIYKIKN